MVCTEGGGRGRVVVMVVRVRGVRGVLDDDGGQDREEVMRRCRLAAAAAAAAPLLRLSSFPSTSFRRDADTHTHTHALTDKTNKAPRTDSQPSPHQPASKGQASRQAGRATLTAPRTQPPSP